MKRSSAFVAMHRWRSVTFQILRSAGSCSKYGIRENLRGAGGVSKE